jgi:hypothetical protein
MINKPVDFQLNFDVCDSTGTKHSRNIGKVKNINPEAHRRFYLNINTWKYRTSKKARYNP